MPDTVNVDCDQLAALAAIAKRNGTQNVFIDIALEWARAANAALIAALIAAKHQQTAWLIEWPAGDDVPPRWWHPEKGWVFDANDAAWFVRNADAAAYLKGICDSKHLIVTEHVFG